MRCQRCSARILLDEKEAFYGSGRELCIWCAEEEAEEKEDREELIQEYKKSKGRD